MRALTPLTLTAWIAVACTAQLAAQDRIAWVTDLRVAREMAQQQNRLVLLHFWSDSCPPCQRLESQVFNQPELIRAVTTAYIPVKIDARQSTEMVNYYRVSSIPTDIIVAPTGREIHRTASPQDANQYISMLDGVKSNFAVGYQMPAETPLLRSGPNRDTAVGNAPQFALDQASRNGDFRMPSDVATASANAAASAGNLPSHVLPPPTGMMVQNPYNSPLSRELPRESSPPLAPPYAGANMADLTTRASMAAAGPAGSPWNSQDAGSNANAFQGYSSAANSAAQYQQPNTGQSFNPSPAPTWNAPPSGGDRNIGQNSPGSIARPWDGAPMSNPPLAVPSAPPPRFASRAPQVPALARNATAGYPPVAMDGYCPVTLVERGKWTKGDSRWGAEHRGRLYLFTTPIEQQNFMADPDRFSPALSGYDAVRYAETGQLLDGKREHGVFYRDRILLFADEASLQRFGARPEYYLSATDQLTRQGGSMR